MFGLRQKLFFGTIGLFVLLLASTMITVYATHAYEQTLHAAFAGGTQTLSAHTLIRGRLVLLAAAADDILDHQHFSDPKMIDRITADPGPEFATLPEPFKSSLESTMISLKDLGDQLHEMEQLPLADRTHFYTSQFHPSMVMLASRLDSPIVESLTKASYHGTVVDTLARNSLTAVLILLLMSVAFAILYLKQLDEWLIVPLRALRTSAQAIESGNLDGLPLVDGTDEIGQVATAFNSMAARLRSFRKLDNARFIRTQETTQLAINSLPDAVAVCTPDGHIELANSMAVEFFQLLPGTHIADLPHGWLVRLLDKSLQLKQRVEPRGYESLVQVFHKNTEYFFLPHIIPLLDGDDSPVGITLVLIDATQLRQIDEAKSDLINTIAHDLKTPLTSMQMALHLLREDLATYAKPGHVDLISTACDDAERLSRMINEFVEKARAPSAGHANQNDESFPPMNIDGPGVSIRDATS